MVLMTRVDGHIDDDELIRVQWIMRKLFDESLSENDVRTLVHEQVSAGIRLPDLLSEHALELDHDQRRRVLEVAFAIASADGTIVDEEDALMARIAKSLHIDPSEYRTLLRHAMVAREFL